MAKTTPIEEEKIEETGSEEDLYEHFKLLVDKGQQPLRIDKYLFNRLDKVSRNRIQLAIKAGSLLVNNQSVKSSYKIKPQDSIALVLSVPPREIKLVPQDIPLDIIYEDEHLIVIDKPAGLVVHPALGNYTGTLVNALLYHFNKKTSGNWQMSAENTVRPGLVHRIDKNTSGLLVVAKNEIAMSHLARQFYQHTIQRTYWALVWGDFTEDKGTIQGPVGRNPKNRKVMAVFPDGDHGKEAITHYQVLERLGYVTLVECKLETGRTHQIRVHMKHIGHPVFNDHEYGGDKIVKGTVYTKYRQFVDNCFKLITRQALHARSLGFVHPATQKQIFFEAPLPRDFLEALDKWKNYTRNKEI